MRARYYLRFCGHPLCDHMGSQAGRALCYEAEVESCSYLTLRDARAAKARLERGVNAGSVSIHKGECPRIFEAAQ
jgi:hypothetical protein